MPLSIVWISDTVNIVLLFFQFEHKMTVHAACKKKKICEVNNFWYFFKELISEQLLMSFSVKTCDRFFDVGLFAKMNQLKYEEFQKLCSNNRRQSFFFYYDGTQKLYIICCWNFIKDCFQTLKVKKLAKILSEDWLHALAWWKW